LKRPLRRTMRNPLSEEEAAVLSLLIIATLAVAMFVVFR